MKRSFMQRRTPIQRKPVLQAEPAIFTITTKHGDRYLWPVKHITEAEFQENVIDYAFRGDQATKWWHATDPTRSARGWFDLVILQPTRGKALVTELKVRDRKGASKQPRKEQWEYIAAAAACGWDVRSWLYPDDEREAFEALTGLSWDSVVQL